MEDKALTTITNSDDDVLLVLYEEQQRIVKQSQNILGHIEHEIFKRCRERQSTGIPSDTFECSIKETFEYNSVALEPIGELLSPAEKATCFTPEHTEEVKIPDKWNVTKLRPLLKKHGKDALDTLEAAKIPKSRKLEFHRKEA